jgi:DNA-directed RNA polymerase subunit RPC12/RpoP
MSDLDPGRKVKEALKRKGWTKCPICGQRILAGPKDHLHMAPNCIRLME